MGKWTLILNSSQTTKHFTSEKKLRGYAKENGLCIKRSPTDPCCFYTEAVGYVPAWPGLKD